MLITAKTIDIEISKRQVCRYLGYDAGSEPPPRVESLIDEYIEHSDEFIFPCTTYTILDVELVLGTRTFIEGSITFDSKVVSQLLRKCQQVALFVATISKDFEGIACGLSEDGLLLQSAVLDAIGSNAVEKVADFVCGNIADIAAWHGLVASKRRFSPGYCDWNVEQQKMLFEAVDGEKAGVELTETCLMLPRKSISGIVGIGLANQGIENYNPCPVCDKTECIGRR
ncbi:vitamin B12 dependent-methionine synthase activation domain-containing protein [Chloroflexota bacterium]